MARPRNRVYDDKGNLVEGLSLHSASRRFYSIDSKGEREYWGREKSKAIRGYRSRGKRKDISDAEAIERLESEGLEEYEITEGLIELVKSEERRSRFKAPSETWLKANRGSPVAEWIKTGKFPKKPKSETNHSKEKLAHCFAEWWSIMLEGASQPSQYMKDVKRAWDRFAQVVGNKSISALTADEFAT